MIDLHCHVLPGVDDGPDTLAQALELARAAVADGITHSVLTSHIQPERYPNQRSNLTVAFEEFRAELIRARIALQVSLGSEARLCPELIDLLAQDQVPFLGEVNGFKILLLELPHQLIPAGSVRFVQSLLKMNIRPLLAHPERNRAVMAQPEKIDEFAQAGCWLQLTAGSLVGRFGPVVQQAAFEIIDAGWDCLLATDAHDVFNRPPLLSEGLAALRHQFGETLAQRMVFDKPAQILGLLNA